MKNSIGIRSKLLLLNLFLSALLLLAMLTTHWLQKQIDNEYERISAVDVPQMEKVDEMFLQYRQVRIMIQTLGLPGLTSPEAIENAIKSSQLAIDEFEKAKDSFVALGLTDEQKNLFTNMDHAWQAYKNLAQQIINWKSSDGNKNLKNIENAILLESPDKSKDFRESIEKLKKHFGSWIADKSKKNGLSSQKNVVLSLLLTFLSFCIAQFISFLVASKISNNIFLISKAINGNSDEVSGRASVMSASAQALSSAMTEQVEAIQSTASAIAEIRATIEQNTNNSAASAKVSAQSKNEASLGKESVQSMINSMQEINESNLHIQTATASGNKRISEIVQIIQEIDSKTKVINDIVFQTKLLSFNASVEAARAGEHGKGFAVVAEEIGNLAQMSGAASNEISSLLADSTSKVNLIVQETSSQVDRLVQESRHKIDKGRSVANACGEALEKIVMNADQLSEMVESISNANQEQSQGIDEIARAISQLEEAIQVNTNEIKQSAESANQLNQQVSSLNHSGTKLKILAVGGNASHALVNLFVWKDDYYLGVDAMDDEHKILINKINLLAESINLNDKTSKILNAYRQLRDYTHKHFSDEERYMESIDYPQLTNHKEIHRSLLAKLASYEAKIVEPQFDPSDLMLFLNDWLIKHILGVDMKYARFAKKTAA